METLWEKSFIFYCGRLKNLNSTFLVLDTMIIFDAFSSIDPLIRLKPFIIKSIF